MPKSSELSISSASEFGLSGLAISFGKTLPYLAGKTVTRRAWKDSHAKKFTNAFHQNKLVKALDKDIRCGGKQIGWCRLLCAPYKEQLAAMPDEDLQAEGGMCSSVAEFVKRYFKGNNSLEVWVIRFEFIGLDRPAQTPTAEALGVYSDSETKARGNPAITPSVESIHQAQLAPVIVSFNSDSNTNSNSPISSRNDSIHQTLLSSLGVYSVIQNKANSNSAVALSTPSIHQALLATLGVYYALDRKTNSSSAVALSTQSIHQAPLATLGIYSILESKTNSNCAFYLSNQSIHQALPNHQTVPGLYPNSGNQVNTNAAISSPAESIHQSSTQSLGVYPSNDNQSDSNATNDSLTESIHQAPAIQGGSGLVYSFWKGETMVNHYRYKVKVNGKWKVKSIYIPVGKLPKVREAIANKLSVAAIVTEVLGRQL